MKQTPRKRGPNRTGRIFFLARLDAIRADLDQGWRMIAIYEKHANVLGISYSQFTRYVREYIRTREVKPEAKVRVVPIKRNADAPASNGIVQNDEPRKGKNETLPTFQFDPMDAYTKKFV